MSNEATRIVTEILAGFDTNKPICIDVETTSFDDTQEAFRPYHGHKTTVIVIGQKNRSTVALPIRHITEGHKCFNIDDVLPLLREWALNVTELFNLNIKFDMHFLAESDGIHFPNAKIADLGVLARLVHNDVPIVSGTQYSLQNLCAYYQVAQKQVDGIKQWKDENKGVKDYGKIPLNILLPYAIADVDAAIALRDALLERLPADCEWCWENECRLTPWLYKSEREGLHIDIPFLQRKRIEVLQRLIHALKDIEALSGITNPDSDDQLREYFGNQGIKSNKKTDGGLESFDKYELQFIANAGEEPPHKVAGMLVEYNKDKIIEGTFCAGWSEHTAPDGIMHPNYRQAGTVSGRSSSSNPNTQNMPKWLMEAILIPNGRVGVAWDLSQIEYRLFAHYSQNDDILSAYEADPSTDFHQKIADTLGLPRKPVKSINFGILYGMGKKKLTNTLRKDIIDNDSDALREHLYSQFYDPFEAPPKVSSGPIPEHVLQRIAENVLVTYHEKNPSVKDLQKQIKQLIGQRGYVKGYYGRRFTLTFDKSYIGLNRVIQGSAADLFKLKMHELCEATKHLNTALRLQVHDAVYMDMPVASVDAYWAIAQKVVTTAKFRVPILMDGEVAVKNWGNQIKIPKNYDGSLLELMGKIL